MASTLQESELNATQYAILAENQRKKKALADTKSSYGRVAGENKNLLKTLEETQRENYEVTEYLRAELLQKTEKIAELEAQLVKTHEDHEIETKKLENLAAVREAKLLTEATSKHKALQSQIDELNSTLNAVMEYKTRQVEVEEEILRLREENQGLNEKMDQQRMELERYYLEINSKMRKEYEQRMEELKKAADEEIDEKLDASVKRILQQNRRMAEELKIHVNETDVLQHEVKILEADRARLIREVALKSELEEGYAKRGAKQSMAIKEAQSKIMTQEQSMQELMQGFERDKMALMRTTQSQLADAAAEAEALKRLVKLKTHELKSVRKLAQEVLLQRSDVETFLLSSLHMIRKEVERESFRATSLTEGDNGTLDIKQLSWIDRERVLRLLFAKINNQKEQVALSTLHSHPLEQAFQGYAIVGGPAELA